MTNTVSDILHAQHDCTCTHAQESTAHQVEGALEPIQSLPDLVKKLSEPVHLGAATAAEKRRAFN